MVVIASELRQFHDHADPSNGSLSDRAPRRGGRAGPVSMLSPIPALVAQGIEHRPPEPGAQVRILSRAPGFGPDLVHDGASDRAYLGPDVAGRSTMTGRTRWVR